MEAGRTSLGLRRGGSGLSRLAAALLAALALSCAGLSETDEARLEVHQDNARAYFEQNDYQRALHQSTLALELEPSDTFMRLIRGHCLLRIGSAARNPALLEESLDAFEALLHDRPDDDRVDLGCAGAHLGRALLLQDEIDRTTQRVQSEFLDEPGRAAERLRLGAETADRAQHLARAEELLRGVLARPLQKDNPIALTDLVIVLHAQPGRDAEALPLAERALELLDESTGLTRTALEKDLRVGASARIELQRRLEDNREKEQALRDLLASAALARGDTAGFLAQMTALERRDLMGEAQYWARAGIHEQAGRFGPAIADLENYLRLRSRRFANYEQDDMASQVFQRIETLRERQASSPR